MGYAVVIGGSNTDIVGTPNKKLLTEDSNLGFVNVSMGGVGRNIAENLAKLDINVKLISVVGNDTHGRELLDFTQKQGVDISHVKIEKNKPTGAYLAILDEYKDMYVAINSMDIFKSLDISYIKKKHRTIEASELILVDTNLEKEVLEYIVKKYKHKMIYLDTVSHAKTYRAKDVLSFFYVAKPNRIEAEAMIDIKINSKEDIVKAAEGLHSMGIKNVCITLGPEGIYYSSKESKGFLISEKYSIKNATGAGDAFQAGLMAGEMLGFSFKDSVKLGYGAALIAMESEETINKEMKIQYAKEKMRLVEEIK